MINFAAERPLKATTENSQKQVSLLMPRYLHIPHTPDTARTLTLSGRNCLVVSGIVTPPLKSATGAEKGAEAKCVHKARRSPTAGLLRALSRICASMRPTSRSLHMGKPSMRPASRSLHVGKPPMCATSRSLHMGKPRDVPHIVLPAHGKAPRCTPQRTIF